MGHLSKAGVLTVRLVQISRSILGEGCELKDYKTPRDVTVGKTETVAFDSSNVEKNESLKGTRNPILTDCGTLTLHRKSVASALIVLDSSSIISKMYIFLVIPYQ